MTGEIDGPDSQPSPSSDESRRYGALARLLAGTVLFRDLSEAVRLDTARRMRVRSIGRGDVVFWAGDPADAVTLLVSGRVRIVRTTEDGQTVILRFIQPGETFGGGGGWGEERFPATAIAHDDSQIAQLSSGAFHDLIIEHPAVAFAVIRDLRDRLSDAHHRILELQTQRVERRVARAVVRLANRAGVPRGTSIELPPPVSREDIANLTGTTLSTVSRILSGWEERGLVRSGRERLTILRPHSLVLVADDIPDRSAPGDE